MIVLDQSEEFGTETRFESLIASKGSLRCERTMAVWTEYIYGLVNVGISYVNAPLVGIM